MTALRRPWRRVREFLWGPTHEGATKSSAPLRVAHVTRTVQYSDQLVSHRESWTIARRPHDDLNDIEEQLRRGLDELLAPLFGQLGTSEAALRLDRFGFRGIRAHLDQPYRDRLPVVSLVGLA